MKKLNIHYLFIALGLCAALASCHKNNDTPQTAVPVTNGIYVINQGVYPSGLSTLSFYSLSTKQVTADEFNAANARTLGTTANDIEIYGSKTYIVVNGSSTVEVINTKTAKSITQIKFFTGNTARSPRSIVFYGSNAFVSSYDGTVAVIDTNTLAITKSITVGNNPETMAISNGKLYVANSGGYSPPNYDNTVSVIDLTTLTQTKKITVLKNPISIAADAYGEIYVLSFGGGTAPEIGTTVINTTTDAVVSQGITDMAFATPIVISGNLEYYFSSDYKVKVYNLITKTTATNFITDGTVVTNPYALTVDDVTGEVFVGDAKNYTVNGSVFAFDKTGKLEYSFTAGVIPGKIALIKQ